MDADVAAPLRMRDGARTLDGRTSSSSPLRSAVEMRWAIDFPDTWCSPMARSMASTSA